MEPVIAFSIFTLVVPMLRGMYIHHSATLNVRKSYKNDVTLVGLVWSLTPQDFSILLQVQR